MKICNTCKVEKEPAEFNKRAASQDGLQNTCRECNGKKARAWRQNNPAKARENSLRSTKALLERNPDYYRQFYAKQYATEAGRMRMITNVENRRARLMNAEGSYTAEEFAELCFLYGNICLDCEQVEPLTVDHVVPLSQGGTNHISNIQPLCRSCNSKKGVFTKDFRPKFAS